MKKHIYLLFFILSFIPFSVLAKPLDVVTSFSILEDITKNIGQEHVNVTSIIKANQNAHTYEPSPNDIILLSKADLFVINGLNFEGWLTRAIDSSGFKGVLVNCSDSIHAITSNEHDNHSDHEHHHDLDPHIWQSPLNVIIMADNIKKGLIAADPTHREFYETNYANYAEELKMLDFWAKKQLATVPTQNLNFLILHDSFKYLERDYPIQFYSILGINLMNEPSAKEMVAITKLIKKNQIKVAFFENVETSRFLKSLINDLQLISGGLLYSDALANDKNINSYIDLFRKNINTIVAAGKTTIQ